MDHFSSEAGISSPHPAVALPPVSWLVL